MGSHGAPEWKPSAVPPGHGAIRPNFLTFSYTNYIFFSSRLPKSTSPKKWSMASKVGSFRVWSTTTNQQSNGSRCHKSAFRHRSRSRPFLAGSEGEFLCGKLVVESSLDYYPALLAIWCRVVCFFGQYFIIVLEVRGGGKVQPYLNWKSTNVIWIC